VWALLRIVGATWRFETIAEEGATPLPNGQGAGREIFCFWHQCVLPCAVYFRHTRATILISRSFDGELITRMLGLLGFRAVRGSSSRSGHEGLMGLKDVIEGGEPNMRPGLAKIIHSLLAQQHVGANLPAIPTQAGWAEEVARCCGWLVEHNSTAILD